MDKDPGKIITFYSYKGGTGRSMILANVAYLLATHPAYRARVLMIDWDLEAPGLHRYFDEKKNQSSGPPLTAVKEKNRGYEPGLSDAPFLAAGEKRRESRPGLIDYFETVLKIYREMAPAGGLPERSAHTEEAVAIYDKIRKEGLYDARTHTVKDIPNLHLMRAGDSGGADYPQQVRSFQWDDFYLNYGSFFPHFRDHLMDVYDYILIDSRTGVTDTSGICTRIMPEKLVTVFAPNLQNIDGILDVIRRCMAHRSASRDPRSLQFFPVASRIDPAASNLRTLWWKGGLLNGEEFTGYEKTFEALFTELFELDSCNLHEYFDATQIPHDSDYAYGEQIAARSRTGIYDRLSIGKACANLTERLVKLKTPWEALPELKTELEEARRHAAEATQKAEELEKEKAKVGKIVGTIAAVTPIALIGAAAAFAPPVLSDAKFYIVGAILTLFSGSAAVIGIRQWMGQHGYRDARKLIEPAIKFLTAGVGAGLVAVAVAAWWLSPLNLTKPSSKAANELAALLDDSSDATATSARPSITFSLSPRVRRLATSLASGDSRYLYVLPLQSEAVPFLVFISIRDQLPGGAIFQDPKNAPQLVARFSNGLDPFRYGMKPPEVDTLLVRLGLKTTEADVPGQLVGSVSTTLRKASSLTLPNPAVNKMPNSEVSYGAGSLNQSLPWFDPCWGGQSKLTMFFDPSAGLEGMSIRFFAADCPTKMTLLQNFASEFAIPFSKQRPIPFQVAVGNSVVAAINGPDVSSLEIFPRDLQIVFGHQPK